MKRRTILQHCQRSAQWKGQWARTLSEAVATSRLPISEADEYPSSCSLRNLICRTLTEATGDVTPAIKPDSHPRVRVLSPTESLDCSTGSWCQRDFFDGNSRRKSEIGSEFQGVASRTSEEVEKDFQFHPSHLALNRPRFAVKVLGESKEEGAFPSDGLLSSEENARPSTAEFASTRPGNSEYRRMRTVDQIDVDSGGATTGLGNPGQMEGGVNSSIPESSCSVINREDHSCKHISEEQVDKLSKISAHISELKPRIAETANEELFPVHANVTGEVPFFSDKMQSERMNLASSSGNSALGSITSCSQLDSRANEDIITVPNVSEQLEKSHENGDEGIQSACAGCGLQPGNAQLFPVPISPLPEEAARAIELERAMVAEMKMKSGPAITRNEVLYEDEYFMVVNKPCGVYSEHVLETVSALLITSMNAQASESLLSRLALRQAPSRKEKSGLHLHMANRLDRDTSGLMIITKCRNAAKQFSNIFTKRYVQKSYIALCRGSRPPWTSLTLETGHGRSRHGAWRVYSRKDVGRGLPGGSVVRDMTTQLTVVAVNREPVFKEGLQTECCTPPYGGHEVLQLDEIGSSLSEEFLLKTRGTGGSDDVVIRAIPKTGRTHQIRLHCQLVGLSLRGDVKYNGDHSFGGITYDHHALHAESLSFRHPFTFEDSHFVAPLPQWAVEAVVQDGAVAPEVV